jgi:CheY-like chemotaxis protein
MNAATDKSDQEVLKGKRILFVEDRPQTLEFFLEELTEVAGEKVDVEAKSLSEAVDSLSKSGANFHMVVIDLHMPGELPEVLKPFAKQIGPDLNEGQTLGLWLRKTFPAIPYLYLSSLPDAYRTVADDKPARGLINKFLESPFDFPRHLAAVLHPA